MPYKSKKKQREYLRKYMRENRKKKKVSVKPVKPKPIKPVKPVKPRRGRKTKLTPKLQEQIIKYVEAGNYNKVACQAVGIGEWTYYNWIKRGEKALELEEKGKKIPESEKKFSQFSQSIRGAEARGEIRNVTIIQIAAKKDWRAALEILARKYPKRWGLKKQIGGTGEEPLPVPTITVVVDAEKQSLEVIDKEVKAIDIKRTQRNRESAKGVPVDDRRGRGKNKK